MSAPPHVRRFWIPKSFHYTRLSQESVEVVTACDYDALAARAMELEQPPGENMSNLTAPDRSPLIEAQMILMGQTGLHPTKEHLEALKQYYDCELIRLVCDIDCVTKAALKRN